MRFVFLAVAAILYGSPALAADKTVTDDVGRTVTIPEKPSRVVVMHEPLLGLPLMELGVNVVGSYGRRDDGSFATAVDFIDTVLGEPLTKPRGIGAIGQIDLEKVRALDPDLIVGTELDAGKADQLSTVAPVYLQAVSTGRVHGFSLEEKLAGLFGRKDVFDNRKQKYLERLEELRKAVPKAAGGQTYLAVFLTDQLNALGSMSGAVQALEDLGYRRLQITSGNLPAGQDGSPLLVPISAEIFGRLNPDLLVVMNSYMSKNRDEAGIRAALDRIVPGWSKFSIPAKEGRVVFVDSAKVTSPTIASSEHTLNAVADWIGR